MSVAKAPESVASITQTPAGVAQTPGACHQVQKSFQYFSSLAKKIASYSLELFSSLATFIKNKLYTTRDWAAKQLNLFKDYLSAHPQEVKAAGIGIATALTTVLVISSLYSFYRRNNEKAV